MEGEKGWISNYYLSKNIYYLLYSGTTQAYSLVAKMF